MRSRQLRTILDLVVATGAWLLLAACALGQAVPAAEQLASAGMRRIESRHLVLITDLPEDREVDEIPLVFDQAVAAWCAYFGVPPDRTADWQMVACLIHDKARFQGTELLPDDLPPFLHGFQRGPFLWVYEQPSAYYRRHLVLHEGTHGFMQHFLGGCGPPWYMEGMAEYLGTHRWESGSLELAHMPREKQEVPYWGRVAIVRDETAAGRPRTLIEIMRYDAQAHRRLEPYGWCWAAATFFAEHPEYREAFQQCRQDVTDSSLEFSRRLYQRLQPKWNEVEMNWYVFVTELDYGYDVARSALSLTPPRPAEESAAKLVIRADRGWQATGLRLEAGKSYQLAASGRFVVGSEPKPWTCEANGVTITYHQGRPLGMLLGAVVSEETPRGFSRPLPIGSQAHLRPEQTGMLFVKVNEASAGLADNQGELTLRVVEE
jgi:hypothetical protein